MGFRTVTDSTITGNSVSGNDELYGGCGGGIYNWLGDVNVIGSVILRNLSDNSGGGIFNNSGTQTVSNVAVGWQEF